MSKREPKPFWKASHKCWYVNVRGKQIRLDEDETKAQEQYHLFLANSRDDCPNVFVLELIAEFLKYSKETQTPRTYEWYKEHLESFYRHIGRMRASALKPFHVEQWVHRRYPNTKNDTTIGNAMRTVKRVFNRAVRLGRLPVKPIAALPIPRSTVRDVYLMPEQYDQFIVAIKDEPFLDLVSALRHTGCRPQEVRTVEARHFDRTNRCWIFPKEEAKGGREERVIHLNDKMFVLSQKLALKKPKPVTGASSSREVLAGGPRWGVSWSSRRRVPRRRIWRPLEVATTAWLTAPAPPAKHRWLGEQFGQ